MNNTEPHPDNQYLLDDIPKYEEMDEPDADWRAHDTDLPAPSEMDKTGE